MATAGAGDRTGAGVGAFLTADEVYRLTKRQKFAAQRRALDELGIRYTQAVDGEPLVRPSDLDGTAPKGRNRGPHWDRIDA